MDVLENNRQAVGCGKIPVIHQLKMEVRFAGVAAVADPGDYLPFFHLFSGLDQDVLAQMAIVAEFAVQIIRTPFF